MDILPDQDIKTIIERLFPWIDSSIRGISEEKILAVEQQLAIELPACLRMFYSVVGNDDNIISSYNQFIQLTDLNVANEKIIFITDKQREVSWGFEVTNNESRSVFKYSKENDLGIKEDVSLEVFLSIHMYMQAIQEEYKHCGIIGLSGDELFDILDTEWKKVIDHKGFHVYYQKGALIWTIEFSEDEDIENDIYFSTFLDELYYLNEIRLELVEI